VISHADGSAILAPQRMSWATQSQSMAIFHDCRVAPEQFVGIDPVIEPGIYIPRM